MRNKTFDILYDFYNHNSYLNLSLKKVDDKNINQITKRVYGVVQNDLYFNYLISLMTDKSIDLNASIILKMSLYEFLFLDSIPKYAIINEYINLCKKKCNRAKKIITFLLHNRLDKLVNVELKFKNEAKNLAIKYSIPQFFVKKLITQYPENYLKIISDVNEEKTTYCKLLEGDKPKECDYFYEDLLLCKSNPLKLNAFLEKKILIQDLGSYLVSKIATSDTVKLALDICAAPGNKTITLSKKIENVVANEINYSRFLLLLSNMKNFGCENVQCINKDATESNQFLDWYNTFDLVLVDAPCSGSGVFKSKPDLKVKLTPKKINDVIETQYKILKVSAKLVRSGGTLLYSTCSINKEENEMQMKKFISENPFKEVKLEGENEFFTKGEIGYTLLPFEFNSDGFYVCKMIKD